VCARTGLGEDGVHSGLDEGGDCGDGVGMQWGQSATMEIDLGERETVDAWVRDSEVGARFVRDLEVGAGFCLAMRCHSITR
jgi:hypothetical protein